MQYFAGEIKLFIFNTDQCYSTSLYQSNNSIFHLMLKMKMLSTIDQSARTCLVHLAPPTCGPISVDSTFGLMR